MEPATSEQFDKLISEIQTKVKHTDIDANAVEIFLANPYLLTRRFIQFINKSRMNLVFGRKAEKEKWTLTQLQSGDQLRFSLKDKTMSVSRRLEGEHAAVLFTQNGANPRDEIGVDVTSREEVMKAVSLLATVFGLTATEQPTPGNPGWVYVMLG
jgi:hypothetical protein